jgi:diguanylate cyclase (GGDEF)-like protein/PAS domain S-box-containing protein
VPAGAPRGEPIGWAAAPIAHFQDVADEATKGAPQDLGLTLSVDLTDAGMGQREDLSRVARIEGGAGARDQAAFHYDEPFEVGGVHFDLSAWSPPTAADPPITYRLVLVAGMVASLFAAGVMYLRVRAHERERAFAAEVHDRAQFQREIVDSVTNAMVLLDGDGAIVAANPAWNELRGIDASDDEAAPDLGRRYTDVLAASLRSGADALTEGLRQVLAGREGAVELDVPLQRDGSRRWYAVRATPLRGRRGGAVVIHTDITERKRSHDELEFKANRDNLTGLLNRAALEAEIEAALRRARADGSSAAVLFIDLDGFKAINDTYGHSAGDEILRAVSTRVTSAVRTSDRVARLGGDEFVVLIAPLPSPRIAESTAERILRALTQPVHVGDHTIGLGASVGVAVVEAPLDVDGADLIERADEAMYRAKQSGGARLEIAL